MVKANTQPGQQILKMPLRQNAEKRSGKFVDICLYGKTNNQKNVILTILILSSKYLSK